MWSAAQTLSDEGSQDVDEHGDDPCRGEGDWVLFDLYPKLTWQEEAVWRRQAARSYDDLAGDLKAGQWPTPTCPGEEMTLHLMLLSGKSGVAEETSGLETTFADLARRGREDPAADANREAGMGDYRAHAWFKPFLNVPPRDGRRTFRR